jgi:hypothetical protein
MNTDKRTKRKRKTTLASATDPMHTNGRSFPWLSFSIILSVCICVHPWFLSPPAFGQEVAQEVAASQAEGRVVICAAKDGIVAATVDTHDERGSRPPILLPLSPLRMGVLLGAVEWTTADTGDKPVRLDSELLRLAGAALNTDGKTKNENGASDIEAIGVALLERIRELAGHLHRKIDIGEDEPLLRLVLVGYVPNYGSEAWTLDYKIRQDDLGNDYWRTRVLRPSYTQLYPPEKGQPRTFLEVRFPIESRARQAPELIDLLRQNDPRLAKIRASSEPTTKSVDFVVGGQAEKSMATADADFLRAALAAVNPPDTKMSMAMVDFDRGFRWLIEPAEPPPVDTTPREPDAPTLRRKPTN